MAKQDTWKRITLRIPEDLHQRLADAARSNSLNAEIIRRLEFSFPEEQTEDEAAAAYEALRELLKDPSKFLKPARERDKNSA